MVHGHRKPPGRLTPGSNNSSIEGHHGEGAAPGRPPILENGGPPSSSFSGGGSNNSHSGRQTGTVPKTKASRKNSVPQEIVAPTRRDLQQHLTDLVHWASTAPSPTNSAQSHTSGQHQHHSSANSSSTTTATKQRNARTPGEGTCFDLDNLSLQDHSRFIPVRPIVRGSYLSEDLNAEHLPHTTIGVVIPTTPSQQQQQHHHHQQGQQRDPLWQHIISPISRSSGASSGPVGSPAGGATTNPGAFRIIPDGAPSQPTSSSSRASSLQRIGGLNSAANRQLDDRILEIQDYIRATSSLINTINQEKIVKGSAASSKMVNDNLNGNPPINSINLETLAGNNGSDSENNNGPRPQSVASIHSTTPGTPDYEDLQQKLQSSTRNMDMIREQQNQILRLQQAAKSQLEDMEKERLQNATSNLLTQDGPPNYENVTEVHDDVSSLMNRMRTLTTFVENQNELANMLGGELLSDELLAEQALLQKKVEDLKNKRGEMADLVNELQSMNSQADMSFTSPDAEGANRSAAMERIVPIEMLSQSQSGHSLQHGHSGASLNSEATLMNCDLDSEMDHIDSELYESESLGSGQTNSVVQEKLAEINAMKDHLKRLQNMMSTVKLIENKVNGPDPVEMARATEEVDRLMNEMPTTRRNVSEVVVPEKQEPEPTMDASELEPVLSERVQALHAMTADLRVQALSLAAERDRLRVIKDEMIRRKAEEHEERSSQRSSSTMREPAPGATSLNYNNSNNTINNHVQAAIANRDREAASEQRKLKEEFEMKKREYESVLEKMQMNVGRQSQSQARQVDFLMQNEGHEVMMSSNGLSKKMQNDQMGGFGGGQSPAINPTPWRRTSSLNSPIVAGQQQPQPLPTPQNMSATIAQLQDQQTMFQQGLTGGGGGGSAFFNGGAYNQEQQGMFPASNSMEGMSSYRGDSLLLQQFIQTQQMLINSISQCNQLLWAQQRELNNLNNAVLMLQERLLKHELCNTVDTSLNMSSVGGGGQNAMMAQGRDQSNMMNNRAESVPPPSSVQGLLTTNGNAANLMNHPQQQQLHGIHNNHHHHGPYMRAQSEQPQFFGGASGTSTANFGNAPQTPLSPTAMYPMYNNQQSMLMRNGNGQQHQQHQQMQAKALNNMTNNLSNNRIARVTGNVQIPHMQGGGGQTATAAAAAAAAHPLFGNNILNLNPMTNNGSNGGNNPNSTANLDHLPPLHHQHHHFANQLHHSHTLNNQVAPGNRANNYWDNFRSYSRQNHLSGNTCKSNEDSCASSSSNYQQTFVPTAAAATTTTTTAQQQQPREASFSMHNSLPNRNQQQLHQSRIQQVLFGKGFQQHCRINSMMDLQQQQQHPQQHQSAGVSAPPRGFVLNNLCRNNTNLILDNLQQLGGAGAGGDLQHIAHHEGAHGTSYPPTNMTLAADILGFHTNPINLGVNAEFAAKSKTQPKGNKKRSRQMTTTINSEIPPLVMPSTRRGQSRGDEDNEGEEEEEEEGNLNLVSATSTKSTSKFFEALKENVRCEVLNLIETNDLRPYFLIELFRDLQLMSSDPTRHQTLQSIQNMYNRYVESTIQEEAMFGGGGGAPTSARLEQPGSPIEEDPQNLSAGEMDNRMLVNDLRMEAKTDNDLVVVGHNRESGRRRDNQAEDSLRRQNKRRYRNRVNEIASKQNFLEQRLGLGFPTSSGSSESTPIRSVNDLIPVTGNDDGSPSMMGGQKKYPPTSSSDSTPVSVSTDCEIIRIVMQEIVEYLQSIEPLNAVTEPVLQRIGTIVVSHLNNALNERLLLTSFRRIDREELMGQLRAFAGKRGKMLRRIEQYLHGRFVEGEHHHPECLAVAGESGENVEVLQKAQKKQNNEQGNVSSAPLMGRNSVIVQQVDGDGGNDEDGAVGTGDLLQMEVNDETGGGAGEQERDRGEDEEQAQMDQIWVTTTTDEEVEILSTNDGSAN